MQIINSTIASIRPDNCSLLDSVLCGLSIKILSSKHMQCSKVYVETISGVSFLGSLHIMIYWSLKEETCFLGDIFIDTTQGLGTLPMGWTSRKAAIPKEGWRKWRYMGEEVLPGSTHGCQVQFQVSVAASRSLKTRAGTLLWDNRRLIGRSLIVLARQVQNNCD